MTIETLSETNCFGGRMGFYRHASGANNCDMQFSVFVPPQAADGKVPVLTFLSGLTCTEENFMVKSGAQRYAAELGIMLVSPDTSPRGEGVPDDHDGNYDFGLAAGFYLNATEEPWSQHYHMYDYVVEELPRLLAEALPADMGRQGIMGHSMGGHGALTIGLKNPGTYQSISAFAPICSPINCPWGQKALGNYLGDNARAWAKHDAVELIGTVDVTPRNRILVDQGLSDQFLEQELYPHLFEGACRDNDVDLDMRRHAGYDHGYYFIASFMEDHLRHHAAILLD